MPAEVDQQPTTQAAEPVSAAHVWHIITPEFPPQRGGVSDYTKLVARGLAASGDEVHVWAPQRRGIENEDRCRIHAIAGFGRKGLRQLQDDLEAFPGRRHILVQWVPHGYGMRSMNAGFCWWLWKRSRIGGDCVDVVVHEPYLTFGGGTWRQTIAAAVHRLMTILILGAARQVWITIPAWKPRLTPYCLGRNLSIRWLPVPNSIAVQHHPHAAAAIRRRFAKGGFLAGHFSTHSPSIVSMLQSILPLLLGARADVSVLLIGIGSDSLRARLVAEYPEYADRIAATGDLDASAVSQHLAACDVMLQPYPDGISTRRTSAMAALAHGIPMVTTTGELSEEFWLKEPSIASTSADDPKGFVGAAVELLRDRERLQEMGLRASQLYADRFDARRVIETLRANAA